MNEEEKAQIDSKEENATETEEAKRKIVTLPDKNDNEEDQTQIDPQDLMFEKPIEEMTKEEIVDAARKWGHRPKEAHRGDPEKWQDPETFLQRARREAPAHMNQIKKQNLIIETQNQIIDNQKKELDRRREDLEPKMIEALENQDHREYRRLQKEEHDLTKQSEEFDKQIVKEEAVPAVSTDTVREMAAACAEWERQHPEYYSDPKIKETADKLFGDFTSKYPNASPRQILDAVTIGVNNVKSNPISYQSSSTRPSTMAPVRKTKSYDNLTDGAKKICNGFANAGCSKEAYIQNASDKCFTWGI